MASSHCTYYMPVTIRIKIEVWFNIFETGRVVFSLLESVTLMLKSIELFSEKEIAPSFLLRSCMSCQQQNQEQKHRFSS